MNTTPTPPLESPEERTARHLRVCQELIELGLDLARAAARVAAKDLARQEAAEEAATSEQPSTETAPSEARAPAPPRKTADAGLLFARLSSGVRQAVALEARLTAGPPTPRRAPADPRRETLRRIFHHVTEHNSNHAEIKRQTDIRIDHELALDPEGEIEIGLLYDTIREDLALDVDFGTLPDELLDLLCPYEEDDDDHRAPNRSPFPPNATGPPR